ncbi:MAG: APC family permease [Ilumatobacteraceae bacterium]|jgi:amino acid transporter|nr:amino acid permease [Actinomycetes bacterium]
MSPKTKDNRTGIARLKELLIGKPIETHLDSQHRLKKRVALPVFASDAISSTAYATEEILIVFLTMAAVGMAAFDNLVPIAIMVVVLLAIVVNSYRQTINAYPLGGGSYIVAKDNLGKYPSLVSGASMLVDYILTVAVSVSGGVAAIVSAFNGLAPYRVWLCVGFIVLITYANLRGIRESGALFAPPTYLYIVSLAALILVGLYRVYFQDLGPISHTGEVERELLEGQKALTLFYFLKAFSSGAVALTGIEAVADGVPAFEKPEPKNANRTLMMMAVILGTSFFGLSLLAKHLEPLKDEKGGIKDTVLAQLAEQVYGGRNVFFFVTQFATFGILILAANTAYADFPRLSSVIAKDSFLPRQFANRGDRLVFSNGVIFLGIAASGLVIAFGGIVNALIPLYAVGVFTGFTISQSGMFVRLVRIKEKQWPIKAFFTGVGALTTFAVAMAVVIVKFTDGAWIPAVIIPSMIFIFTGINRHYVRVKSFLAVADKVVPPFRTHFVVVLVGSVNAGVVQAVKYAQSLRPDRLLALSVVGSDAEGVELDRIWRQNFTDVELITPIDDFRNLTDKVLEEVERLDGLQPDDLITVVIPEFVTSIRSQWLHNQSALAIKARLLFRPNTVVTSVPIVIP